MRAGLFPVALGILLASSASLAGRDLKQTSRVRDLKRGPIASTYAPTSPAPAPPDPALGLNLGSLTTIADNRLCTPGADAQCDGDADDVSHWASVGRRGGAPALSNATKWPVYGDTSPVDGVTDSVASALGTPSTIQTAVNNASAAALGGGQEGWVVGLPSGTATWASEQQVAIKTNVIVRGHASGTRINGEMAVRSSGAPATCNTIANEPNSGTNWNCGIFHASGSAYGTPVAIANAASLVKGATTLELTNANATTLGAAAGEWVLLTNTDDSGACFVDQILSPATGGGGGFLYALREVVSVATDSPSAGTTSIVLDEGMTLDWSPAASCTPRVRKLTVVENAGLDRITLGGALPFDGFNPIMMVGAYGLVDGWFGSITFIDPSSQVMQVKNSAFVTVANSHFRSNVCMDTANWTNAAYWDQTDEPDATTDCSRYQLLFEYAARRNLAVNNIFEGVQTGTRMYLGNERNVVASNYITHGLVNEAVLTVHQRAGLWTHGGWSWDTLFEGNDLNGSAAHFDSVWGANGQTVLHRNRIRGSGSIPGQGSLVVAGGVFVSRSGGQYQACPECVFINNHAWAWYNAQYCDPYSAGNCDGVDFDYALASPAGNRAAWRGQHHAYNIARDSSTDASKGYVFGWSGDGYTPNSKTTCQGSNCTFSGVFVVDEEVDDASSSWAAVTLPASLWALTEAAWETATGATWCSESCSYADPQAGLGALGDDFGGTLCKLPAQRRFDGESCS